MDWKSVTFLEFRPVCAVWRPGKKSRCQPFLAKLADTGKRVRRVKNAFAGCPRERKVQIYGLEKIYFCFCSDESRFWQVVDKDFMTSYLLKLTLQGTPNLIWRRFVVPSFITLSRLHDVVQTVMRWEQRCPHLFLVKKQNYVPAGIAG